MSLLKAAAGEFFLRKRFKDINFCCKKYKKNRLFKVKREKKFGAEGAEKNFPQQGGIDFRFWIFKFFEKTRGDRIKGG